MTPDPLDTPVVPPPAPKTAATPVSTAWVVRGNNDSAVLRFAFSVDEPTARRQFCTEYPGLARQWTDPTFTPGEGA